MRLLLSVSLLGACTSTEPPAPASEPVAPPAPEPPPTIRPVPPAPLAASLPALGGKVNVGDRVLIRDGGRLRAAPDPTSTSAALRIAARADAPQDVRRPPARSSPSASTAITSRSTRRRWARCRRRSAPRRCRTSTSSRSAPSSKWDWLNLRSEDGKPARISYDLEIGVRAPLPE